MKLKSQEENLETLQEDVRIRERKLQELTEKLNAKDSVMQLLRNTINDALRGISAEDLTVSEYQGKVYVSLSQNLLFAKGSTVIDPAGRDALRKLAGVLKKPFRIFKSTSKDIPTPMVPPKKTGTLV